MSKRPGTALLVCAIALTLQACKKTKVTESEFYAYDSGVRATQLAFDVRVFDAICRGDTNMAKRVLASQIDAKLFLLEYNSKLRPLEGATKSLYNDALAYRNKNAELERLNGSRLTNAPDAQISTKEELR